MSELPLTSRLARRVPRIRDLVEERDALLRERKQLRRELRGHRENATRFGGHSVEERDFDYLFVMTYGRSGSTLLQGILCSTPGFLIRGENRAAMYGLYRFHRAAAKGRDDHLGRERALTSRHPFYGIDGYSSEVAFSDLRQTALDTLIRPGSDARVVGFKEVRWSQKDLPDYVNFLRRVFPGARFVVNTRAHDSVSQSKWWAEKPAAARVIAQREEAILSVAEDLGDAAYRVHYDDYVADPANLAGLFEWLGEDFDLERVRQTMERKHSY